ncbi:SAM-dependent methyltransferase [Kocuria rosea]|uniref:SAM-dependent methyltransferase n=1 Tax=Kocuria rosea TaxID=1275 RepID=UPI00068F5ABB|nr:class I SAM-dependent methyltransferase [Kocuria polaris]
MTTTDAENLVEQRAQELFGLVSAAATTAMILVGDRLGLYPALAGSGPVTSAQLAEDTGTHERYVREWLAQQAAAGILGYDAADGTFTLSAEWAAVLADDGMVAACLLPTGMFRDVDPVLEAFRTGEGIAWGQHDPVVFEQTERFWSAQYRRSLVTEWIPALDGVAERLTAGATVADVGTGHGAPLIMLAQAFPRSRFVGFDSHAPSIEIARARAAEAGVADRVSFEVAHCHEYPGHDYDLVTFVDAFHDLGDPVGAAAYARHALAPGGSIVLVELQAGDDLAGNLANPAAPLGYAASTFLCTPNSLSQPVGLALGGQAGAPALQDVLTAAGFRDVNRVADTPFNMVLQARP